MRLNKMVKTTAAKQIPRYLHVYSTNADAGKRGQLSQVHTSFYMDSYDIYVDNCASRSMTKWLAGFVNAPVPADVCIQGTNGTLTGTLMGTVQWAIEDD